MFDFLKKKLTGFIDKVTGKGEGKEEPIQMEASQIEKREESVPGQHASAGSKLSAKEKKPIHIVKHIPKPDEKIEVALQKKKTIVSPILPEAKSTEPKKGLPVSHAGEKSKEKGHELNVGLFGHLKSVFTGEVEISRHDIREMLDGLELELIESDVALEVAEGIRKELETRLVGRKIRKPELNPFIKNAIRGALLDIISSKKAFDITDAVRTKQKPAKIMFLGINGGGKTTTIAKVAKLLMDANYTVVLAAADTFRAAAIEQLSIHADKLGVKIIKRDYGSDPTAVAYDAMSYASAHNIDVVLIDTAGRQETNYNLLNEMKKMQRVIQPDLKIYIGESIAGNAIISQVSEFSREIGVDAVILTKLDCDAKGGTVLSISKITGIPIIYLGTGQKYEDLEKFDADEIVERILG